MQKFYFEMTEINVKLNIYLNRNVNILNVKIYIYFILAALLIKKKTGLVSRKKLLVFKNVTNLTIINLLTCSVVVNLTCLYVF